MPTMSTIASGSQDRGGLDAGHPSARAAGPCDGRCGICGCRHGGIDGWPLGCTGCRGRAQLGELARRHRRPLARQRSEQLLEPQRHLDIAQRVAAETRERVVGVGVGPTEQLGEEGPDRLGRDAVAARRAGLRGLELGGVPHERRRVGLAARRARELGDGVHPHDVGGQARDRHRALAGAIDEPVGRDEQQQALVRARCTHGHAVIVEQTLDAVEVDAQPEHLHEPARPADDLEEPVGAPPGEVPGAELVDRATRREVRRLGRVAHHDVRAVVHEFADALGGRLVDAEAAARDRDADRPRRGLGEPRRQVGHACRRLGLPVHDGELEAPLPPERGEASHAIGVEAPTGLGDVSQARNRPALEAARLEEVEGVRDPRERGRCDRPELLPERLLHDGAGGQQQAAAGDQVAVHDRQSVAVVQRQRGRGAIALTEVEVVADRNGVAQQVVVAQPHELRRSGRPRGAREQREIGVQLVPGAGAALDEFPPTVVGSDDVGVEPLDEAVAVLDSAGTGAVAVDEEHRVSALERREVRHDRLDLVRAGDHHQPAGRPEFAPAGVDAVAQVAVVERGVAAEERRLGGAAARQPQRGRLERAGGGHASPPGCVRDRRRTRASGK